MVDCCPDTPVQQATEGWPLMYALPAEEQDGSSSREEQ
jgi:hypothetical protein